MGTTLVGEADPLTDGRSRVRERGEVVLPDALLFEATEEAFDEAVLLRCVGGDELLAEAVVAAGGAKAAGGEDEPVVAPHGRRHAFGTQGTEALQAGVFESSFCLSRPTTEAELVADDGAVVAVDDSRQVTPAVGTTEDVREIDRPTAVRGGSDARAALHPRPGRHAALVHEPALGGQDAVDRLLVDGETVAVPGRGRGDVGSQRWRSHSRRGDFESGAQH